MEKIGFCWSFCANSTDSATFLRNPPTLSNVTISGKTTEDYLYKLVEKILLSITGKEPGDIIRITKITISWKWSGNSATGWAGDACSFDYKTTRQGVEGSLVIGVSIKDSGEQAVTDCMYRAGSVTKNPQINEVISWTFQNDCTANGGPGPAGGCIIAVVESVYGGDEE